MELTVNVTGLDEVTRGFSVLEQQLPYATSRAINAVLDDAQKDIRASLKEHFLLRRPEFIERTIYIGRADRATKSNLVGTVRVNPERNVLAKFESDTTKTPQRASTLAVPVFKQDAPGIVISRSDPRYIKRLMASLQKTGAAKGRVGRKRGAPKPLIAQKVYLAKSEKGTFLIERTGTTTRVLYAFEKSVPIKPDLHFVDIASATADRQWTIRMGEALEQALATAR